MLSTIGRSSQNGNLKAGRFNIELVTYYSNSSGSGIEGGHHTDGAKEEAGK